MKKVDVSGDVSNYDSPDNGWSRTDYGDDGWQSIPGSLRDITTILYCTTSWEKLGCVYTDPWHLLDCGVFRFTWRSFLRRWKEDICLRGLFVIKVLHPRIFHQRSSSLVDVNYGSSWVRPLRGKIIDTEERVKTKEVRTGESNKSGYSWLCIRSQRSGRKTLRTWFYYRLVQK